MQTWQFEGGGYGPLWVIEAERHQAVAVFFLTFGTLPREDWIKEVP